MARGRGIVLDDLGTAPAGRLCPACGASGPAGGVAGRTRCRCGAAGQGAGAGQPRCRRGCAGGSPAAGSIIQCFRGQNASGDA
ncbi:hypothetical protein F0M17_14195 [Glutamicibacter sp. ZJUTW]|nr:hypothetical protein F0M17_14195 [Glutamicibacter sp. ZJUTW]